MTVIAALTAMTMAVIVAGAVAIVVDAAAAGGACIVAKFAVSASKRLT
jgi:hypothetical protein